MHKNARRLSQICAVVWLAGCASRPAPQPPEPVPTPAPAPASAPTVPSAPTVAAPLAHEQRWLRDLFQGTPVNVAAGPRGELRVEVPVQYAFDAGQPAVKPPLGAVLDKVAASLGRLPRTRVQVAAPAAERNETLRNALVARGVAAYRIDRLPDRADAVELRLLAGPAAIDKLEDAPPTRR